MQIFTLEQDFSRDFDPGTTILTRKWPKHHFFFIVYIVYLFGIKMVDMLNAGQEKTSQYFLNFIYLHEFNDLQTIHGNMSKNKIQKKWFS